MSEIRSRRLVFIGGLLALALAGGIAACLRFEPPEPPVVPMDHLTFERSTNPMQMHVLEPSAADCNLGGEVYKFAYADEEWANSAAALLALDGASWDCVNHEVEFEFTLASPAATANSTGVARLKACRSEDPVGPGQHPEVDYQPTMGANRTLRLANTAQAHRLALALIAGQAMGERPTPAGKLTLAETLGTTTLKLSFELPPPVAP